MLRVIAALTVVAALASAQPAPGPTSDPAPAPEATADPAPDATVAVITVGGYLEAYYQGQVQDSSNRITNLRGYDNRSRTFTLSNVALDVKGEKGPLAARIIVQFGHTGATSYLAEPVSLGTGGWRRAPRRSRTGPSTPSRCASSTATTTPTATCSSAAMSRSIR